jgi:hypothetical protein
VGPRACVCRLACTARPQKGYASPVSAILSTNGEIGGHIGGKATVASHGTQVANGAKASSKKQGLAVLEADGMSKEDLARVSDEEARKEWGKARGKAGCKKAGLSILEAGGMSKQDLARVSDKEARQAWGRKWSGVAGSAPCKDAALKSANRNEFHWSAEASALFQDAVTELGGLSLANRKSICDLSDSPARTPSPPNLSSGSKSPAEGQAAGSCCHQPAANARCGTCSARTKEAEYICSRWVDG